MSNIYCSLRCIVFATLCFAATSSWAQPPSQPAKQLYQEAAAAIRSADYKASIAALEQLLQHEDQSFAQVVRPHLAELYLATGNTDKALQFAQQSLTERDKETSTSSTDAKPDTNASTGVESDSSPGKRLERVWLKAALQTTAPDKRKQALQAILARLNVASTPGGNDLLAAAALGLIRTHISLAEFSDAQNLADQFHTINPQIARHKEHLPLQAAKEHFANKRIRECDTALAQLDLESLSQDDQVAARFLLLECSLRRSNLSQAAIQSDWFDALLPSFPAPPSWAATLRLRQTELHIARRDYAKARETIQLAKDTHPDFKLLYEFDFLAVRIAIATIDFTCAEKSLQQLASVHAINTSPGIRARWMHGELEFMRRRYASAAALYQQVADCDQAAWKPLGLLQLAKCQELLGEADKAIASYSLVLEHAEKSKDVAATSATATQEARRRIAALQSAVVPTR
ncbi:MAG: hypothetical protein Aurels2KO_04540 [Aureliella sp.]